MYSTRPSKRIEEFTLTYKDPSLYGSFSMVSALKELYSQDMLLFYPPGKAPPPPPRAPKKYSVNLTEMFMPALYKASNMISVKSREPVIKLLNQVPSLSDFMYSELQKSGRYD